MLQRSSRIRARRSSRWAIATAVARVFAWVGLLAVSAPDDVRAQVGLFPDEVERLDVITIARDGRNLLAVSSVSGTQAKLRLDLDEVVLFKESRGRVAVVLTDRRALAITVSGSFQQIRYRLMEEPPERAILSQRIVMVPTPRRVLAFVGPQGVWIEEDFTPGEHVEAIRAGAAVGIATTNRRALGLAPEVGRFNSLPIRIKEELQSIEVEDTLATIYTDQRILVFTGPRGIWTFQGRELQR